MNLNNLPDPLPTIKHKHKSTITFWYPSRLKQVLTLNNWWRIFLVKLVLFAIKSHGRFILCPSPIILSWLFGIYLLKVNNKNTRTRYEICSKLTVKTPERRKWRRSGVIILKFEHISHLVLVFLLLNLSK